MIKEIDLSKIAQQLSLPLVNVENTRALLDEGATIPFISRYRKERTGGLDEVQIQHIQEAIALATEVEKRRAFVLKSIDDQGKLDSFLKRSLQQASTLVELEDLYLPYKPKRRTKATIARENGLEPLADKIFKDQSFNPSDFIAADKGVRSEEEALQGARDIIAEWINENQVARRQLRVLFEKKAFITSKVLKGKIEEGEKYKDYFDWSELLAKSPSHRILAMRRGENEGVLSVGISPQKEEAIATLERLFCKGRKENCKHIALALKDAYKRLTKPSLETELLVNSKKRADAQAIQVFSENLRELLLAAPLGEKVILALDPGFRTGCKLVVLGAQGQLLHNETIFPNAPQKQHQKSGQLIEQLIDKYQVEAIAIGNGTASRETEAFVQNLKTDVATVVVNESGASIYSASAVAREEFPDHDVTVRGAVSIGRRLADPLAELVKLDAKSIGVGQYQHDVDQTLLKKALDSAVSSCVNQVGVELNTASKELLTYVSGLGPQLAQNIVDYRTAHGGFSSRRELKKVKRMGAKAFEQAAGFLRIRDAKNTLDQSAIHPESYHIVEAMARDQSCKVPDFIANEHIREAISLQKYVTDQVGLLTLQDILQELEKPGRDPREEFKLFSFADGIHEVEDLHTGMRLPGIVTNVTNFGAFVDIGVHQDGLVHISELSDGYVSDPSKVVKVAQQVEVVVKEVDVERKRIGLSMKTGGAITTSKNASQKPKKNGVKKVEESNSSFSSRLDELKSRWP